MDRADQIAEKALLTGSGKPHSAKRPHSTDHKRVMIAMWTAMAEAFGHSWSSQYGTSEGHAFTTWSCALEAYSPEQIKRGVRNATDAQEWAKDFPPNLSQFARLCLTDKTYAQPYHRPFKGLEHKPTPASPEVRKREMARIHKLYAGESIETFEQAYNALELNRRWGPLPK